MPLRWELIHKEGKETDSIPMPCFGCGSDTPNRVRTDVPLGHELSEDGTWHMLWAPLCDECLNEMPFWEGSQP